MNLLGIDIGLVKTGVARSEGSLVEPLTVIYEKDRQKLVEKIKKLAAKEGVEKIVIGLPEGLVAPLVQGMADLFRKAGWEVVLWDETLTTQDAQRLAIEAGVKKTKRQKLEDAFSAAVMLQSYIDDN